MTRKSKPLSRKPDKLIRQVRRRCNRNGCELTERQNGTSHWVGKVKGPNGNFRGSLVVPRGHGELKTGTWRSIASVVAKMGLVVLVLGGLLALVM